MVCCEYFSITVLINPNFCLACGRDISGLQWIEPYKRKRKGGERRSREVKGYWKRIKRK